MMFSCGFLLLVAPSWPELQQKLPAGTSTLTRERIIDTVMDPSRPSFSSERPTLFRERNGWCPYSERVWIALEAKRIPYDTVLIDNMGRGRPSYFSGQTPQLRYPNGDMQSESIDIIRRLDKDYPTSDPTPSLFPSNNNAADAEVSSLVNAFKSTFPRNTRPSSRSAFLFYNSGQPVFRSEFEDTLSKTDALLAKHGGPFFYGRYFTAADCCWAPFLERYACQLPVLHRGLDPRDATRWPYLAAWYEHMETSEETSFYPSRVQGDRESWEKVLFMSGYGNGGDVPETSDAPSATTMLEKYAHTRNRDNALFVQYSRQANAAVSADSPSHEAAIRVIRNRAAIVADVLREAGRSSGSSSDGAVCGGMSSDEIDRALRCIVSCLLTSSDCDRDRDTGGGEAPADKYTYTVGTGESSQSDPADRQLRNHAQQVAAYFTSRICVPRDMGVLPARALRQLDLRLSTSNII